MQVKFVGLPFSSNILYTTSTTLSRKFTSVTVLATCLNVAAGRGNNNNKAVSLCITDLNPTGQHANQVVKEKN